MNQRERLLAIGLAAVLGGWFVLTSIKSRIVEPLRQRDGQILALRTQLETERTKLEAAQKGALELSVWRKSSLPADESVAQTLYLDFIRRILSDAGIDRPTLRPGRSIDRADVFSRLPVTVDARANLDQLTAFLKTFESAPLLHQIRRLRIQPVLKESKIEAYDLSLSLEAVAMPDSFAKDSLPTAETAGDALALRPKRNDQEFKVFVAKNPFQPTTVTKASAQPAASTGPAVSDERSDYYLRAILSAKGESVVWFIKQNSDSKKILKVQDSLEVGGFKAQLVAIESDGVSLKVGEETGMVQLGKNLASWKKTQAAGSAPSPTNTGTSDTPPTSSLPAAAPALENASPQPPS